MAPNHPLVSIKIASYNHGRFIGQAIRSVLSQSYQNFELIIVDDCSQDDSVSVIRSFSDPRITLLVNEKNLGAPATSERAKALCRGKYFCSLDSDDYFHPDKLREQVSFLEAHPDVDVVATFIHAIDSQGSILVGASTASWFNQAGDFNRPESWVWANRLCHSSALMKREVHDRLWAYDFGLPLTNDWHNWIRFLANGVVFDVVTKPLTYYRLHANNITAQNPYRTYWEYAWISAKVFHPYLCRIGRRDLIRKNVARFFSDDRYPQNRVERECLLRLLLDLGLDANDFRSLWSDLSKLPQSPRPVHYALPLIEEMRQELIESRRHLESMRADAARAEGEIFKIPQLLSVLQSEKLSLVMLSKVAYLAGASIVPDIIKWPLRPVIGPLRGYFRGLLKRSRVAPYSVILPSTSRERRPTVVHAIANFNTGGSSRLVVDLIEHLGCSYEQQVMSSFVPSPPAYAGCATRECRSLFDIGSFLDRCTPDIVHVHYWGDKDWAWYDKVFRATERIGCRVIENVNTPVTPYVARHIRRYIYVSQYVMDTFGRDEKISSVVYPGSDFALFSRKDFSVKPGNCIGMVYRLEPDKLNSEAVQPFILVAKRSPETLILIVGDGLYLDDYKRQVVEQGVAGSFRFVGAVPYAELPALYARMKIFVAPVWKESFGQVTPFAMAMGLPVVGYAVGALGEILGDQDLLARPGDSRQLADIIVGLLADPDRCAAIGERNRRRALSMFSIETMVDSYRNIYRDVIEEAR
jgi:glycosyltransferase involved in cell wall biosynthesis